MFLNTLDHCNFCFRLDFDDKSDQGVEHHQLLHEKNTSCTSLNCAVQSVTVQSMKIQYLPVLSSTVQTLQKS